MNKQTARSERRARSRRPTLTDLTPRQRTLYEALPTEFKAEFMELLPDIRLDTAGNKKKVTLLEERSALIESVVGRLRDYQATLHETKLALERGENGIDLRRVLGPPEIDGVALRFVRGKRSTTAAAATAPASERALPGTEDGEETTETESGEPTSEEEEPQAAKTEHPKTTRKRRTRKAQPAQAVEPEFSAEDGEYQPEPEFSPV